MTSGDRDLLGCLTHRDLLASLTSLGAACACCGNAHRGSASRHRRTATHHPCALSHGQPLKHGRSCPCSCRRHTEVGVLAALCVCASSASCCRGGARVRCWPLGAYAFNDHWPASNQHPIGRCLSKHTLDLFRTRRATHHDHWRREAGFELLDDQLPLLRAWLLEIGIKIDEAFQPARETIGIH